MRKLATAVIVTLLAASLNQSVWAHCQVPCGVYGDQRRFEEMLEDTTTIAKGQNKLQELIEGMSSGPDAQTANQLARWVATKEAHAANTQKIVAQYFLAQRIKPTAKNYVKQLTSAHAVIIAAMKCKQSADPATAKALEKAIHGLYEAYEGKKLAVAHKHKH